MAVPLKVFSRLAVGADQAGFESGGQVKADLPAIAQAGHVEEILGLHECRGEHSFGGQYADVSDGGVIGHAILIIVWSNRVKLPSGGWSVLFFHCAVQSDCCRSAEPLYRHGVEPLMHRSEP